MSEEMTTEELPTVQAKYEYCYAVYEQCAAQLGCRLPPCDTEVFGGDYTRWPTFRDLFTALYIQNPRLSEVEKLFYLNLRPASAWSSLTERFENKRLLVNSQLRILFNLPAIGQESGSSIQELQSTIQGCLTALEHSKINVENWDCILVFLCSPRLPKLTLSLWEQSIQKKSDIPTWVDMNAFLLERHRTLEAIAEVSSSTNAPTVPRASRKEAPVSRQDNSFESRVTIKTQTCNFCSRENHPIRLCPRFLQMGVNERVNHIKQQKLCLNCFARGHVLAECTTRLSVERSRTETQSSSAPMAPVTPRGVSVPPGTTSRQPRSRPPGTLQRRTTKDVPCQRFPCRHPPGRHPQAHSPTLPARA
ncbi:uncharacterized protein LOC133849865 [Drosophila sulfurigaster albostrigata]|uniref:uncharacterized protein LOC133849865 n=1 Tax=Drosophila sulfurigaster albostrigata TaxID=89887 RepID=UPI002D21C5F8|nr:uncharacterized protein LOC133849865 [Drosophila sulfurigaster albostrigata]